MSPATRRAASVLWMRCGSSTFRTISATSKSLVTHPATTTHSRLKPEARAELGIGDLLVRFSAGLEAEADLLDDIEQALSSV